MNKELKEIFEKSNLTHLGFAEAIGISRITLYKILTNKIILSKPKFEFYTENYDKYKQKRTNLKKLINEL